jgi:hypothetical protein
VNEGDGASDSRRDVGLIRSVKIVGLMSRVLNLRTASQPRLATGTRGTPVMLPLGENSMTCDSYSLPLTTKVASPDSCTWPVQGWISTS